MSYKWIRRSGRQQGARVEQSCGNLNKVKSASRVSAGWRALNSSARASTGFLSQNLEERGFGDVYKYKCRFSMYIPSFFLLPCRIPTLRSFSPSSRCTMSPDNILSICTWVYTDIYISGSFFSLLDNASLEKR